MLLFNILCQSICYSKENNYGKREFSFLFLFDCFMAKWWEFKLVKNYNSFNNVYIILFLFLYSYCAAVVVVFTACVCVYMCIYVYVLLLLLTYILHSCIHTNWKEPFYCYYASFSFSFVKAHVVVFEKPKYWKALFCGIFPF